MSVHPAFLLFNALLIANGFSMGVPAVSSSFRDPYQFPITADFLVVDQLWL